MCYCNGCAIINKAVFNSSSGHDDQPPAEYFCYFYTNQTYSCKTDCEPNGEDQKLNSSTNGSNVNFYDMLCKSNMPLSSDKRWKIGPHSIVSGQHRQTNTAHDSEILATCSFYKSMVFDCNGVTDCKEADNENRCGSAAPWSGRYSGSPENGFKVDGTIVRTGSDAGNG
ncbi:hypothetical protein BV898_17076 [Hypsibius exemplaris]|uniref:Uncharacterized protein n=1 Tax=Hypsibius exemplaris TaxID=2072580 RepID=A0A9X6NH25_HYPEX|nr:hypothetical protein BV898_17076 [Hypsibius exemplaris]